jgi:hypothetical protein
LQWLSFADHFGSIKSLVGGQQSNTRTPLELTIRALFKPVHYFDMPAETLPPELKPAVVLKRQAQRPSKLDESAYESAEEVFELLDA